MHDHSPLNGAPPLGIPANDVETTLKPMRGRASAGLEVGRRFTQSPTWQRIETWKESGCDYTSRLFTVGPEGLEPPTSTV